MCLLLAAFRFLWLLFLFKWRWPTALYLNARSSRAPTTMNLFWADFLVFSLIFFTRLLDSRLARTFRIFKLKEAVYCWVSDTRFWDNVSGAVRLLCAMNRPLCYVDSSIIDGLKPTKLPFMQSCDLEFRQLICLWLWSQKWLVCLIDRAERGFTRVVVPWPSMLLLLAESNENICKCKCVSKM